MPDPVPSSRRALQAAMDERSAREGDPLRWVLPVLGLSFWFLFFLVFAGLTVATTIEQSEPVVWGTFTETSCEANAKGGCFSTGNWVSDDGAIVKNGIGLDGSVDEPGGSIRAGFRPTGVMSDDDLDIVHEEGLVNAGPWVTGACAVGMAGWILHLAHKWGVWPNRHPRRRVG